jgi:hypothetical protein
LNRDAKPRLTGLQFSLMALSICITVAVVGSMGIASRRAQTNSRSFFIRSASSVVVVGYELGHPLALPECPTTGGIGIANAYTYAMSERCFKHVTQTDIGKPLSKKEAVLVEQLDIAKQYVAANWARPICIGVVDGNVEALEVSVNANGDFLAATKGQLGEPAAYRGQQDETLRASIAYRTKEWSKFPAQIQLAERTSYSKGRGGIAISDIVIAYTPMGEPLVRNTWNTFRSACGVAY